MSFCRSGIRRMGREDLRRLQDRLLQNRIPAVGSLELTRRCNLRCQHCYAGPAEPGEHGEWPADRWLHILKETAGAGCLTLLITGGEPLLRSDLQAIYRRAKELGMLVTVFTNGTLIGPEITRLFQEWPPEEVEITLLGASAATHDRLTGTPGSFHRSLRGVEALLGAGVRAALKAMIMRPNLAELEALEQLACGYGVSFRIDTALFPRFDGERSPLDLRLTPREAAAAELCNPSRKKRWEEARVELNRLPIPSTGRLFMCGAGRTSFHIDPAGRLTPCLMLQTPFFDLSLGSFREGWASLAALPELEAPEDYPCRGCEHAPICGVCPAQSQLETGAAARPPNFCCELSRERYTMLTNNTE